LNDIFHFGTQQMHQTGLDVVVRDIDDEYHGWWIGEFVVLQRKM
jgi:hypothetical protein